MAKRQPTIVHEIPLGQLSAYKRKQWFETAKIAAQIFLMWVLVVALLIFLVLIIVAGTTDYLPNTVGVQALRTLFVEIAENAKTVVLFALGIFFREYINTKLSSEND